ncbi:MAG TPA: transcriptional repressor LexA [Bacillota bacterium]|nr:transcriptional repressor LexA [Bacillota bacterium]
MAKLSERQQMIYDYIKAEVDEKGYPPSVREIAKAVGLASSSTVHGHLSRMEAKGFIRRDPTKPRAIEILPKIDNEEVPKDDVLYAPLIGKVTAGIPITAVENIEEYIPIPKSHANADANLFVLSIEGDSMIEAGILDGDLIIVQQQNVANNGEIVVAMTEDDEATVKRFFKEKDHIRLEPENSTMQAQTYPTVTILGKVIGLYRSVM